MFIPDHPKNSCDISGMVVNNISYIAYMHIIIHSRINVGNRSRKVVFVLSDSFSYRFMLGSGKKMRITMKNASQIKTIISAGELSAFM